MALALNLETNTIRVCYDPLALLRPCTSPMLVFHTWHLNWSSIPHSEGIALSQSTLPLETAVPLGEMVPLESTVPLLYIKVQLEGTFAGAVSSPQMLKSTSESVDQKSRLLWKQSSSSTQTGQLSYSSHEIRYGRGSVYSHISCTGRVLILVLCAERAGRSFLSQ